MRRTALAFFAVAALVLTFALANAPMRADAQGPPPGGPGGPGGPPPGGMLGMPVDSFVAERDSMIKVVLEDLGDRKGAPAESVFKNLKVMKGLPAERMLGAMNSFSHALGVSCRHCHVPGHWKDDDKKPKALAREMMKMSSAINEDYLGKMDFGDDKPHVGCMTCHRGEKEPMHAMRSMMRRPGGPGGPGAPGGPGGPPQGGTPPGDHH
jgi:hypothetical protein